MEGAVSGGGCALGGCARLFPRLLGGMTLDLRAGREQIAAVSWA